MVRDQSFPSRGRWVESKKMKCTCNAEKTAMKHFSWNRLAGVYPFLNIDSSCFLALPAPTTSPCAIANAARFSSRTPVLQAFDRYCAGTPAAPFWPPTPLHGDSRPARGATK
jgi:hypothetical protein